MKRSIFAAVLAVFTLSYSLVSTVSTAASQTSEPEFKYLTSIAGVAVACRDFRGKVVTTIKVDELGDVGRAWVVNTDPFIIMDTHLLRQLPAKLQLFFYAHECAHHILGHWYSPSVENEKEADCWAIRYGRDTELFRRQEIADFAPWLAASKGSPFGHLPGPLRARHLLECFDNPEPLLISHERKSLFVR